jgi:CRISPR/Cas system-associated exonuclease Cas4 (RecB family)
MLSCPYKYKLQYVDKRDWDYIPSAVMFGQVTHEVIGRFNNSLMNGAAIQKQELVDAFKQQFSVNIGNSMILYKDADEPTQLLERGQQLIAAYYDQFHQLKPIEVEMEFRLPIIDTNTGEMASRDVVGKMDLLADETVYEIKTAGKSMPVNAVNSNLQLLLYGWAYRVIYGEVPKQLGIINLVKTKQPKIQVLTTKLNGDKQEKLVRLMFNVILAIDRCVFYPNPLSTYGCDNCSYSVSCEYTF